MNASLREALAGLAATDERFLFFDYDGTLSPIAIRAALAVTQPGVLEQLEALARQPGTRVGIVTGRPLDEIRSRIPLSSVFFAAVHGLIIEGPGISLISPEAERLRPAIRRAVSELDSALDGMEGVELEDKGLTVAVHFRRASDKDAEKAAAESRRLASETDGIRPMEGKEVVELRPDIDWDKGRAVELLLERMAGPDWEGRVAVFYVGDDQTDEDAYRRLGSPTGAQYRVQGPDDVLAVMAELNSILESKG
jgi:trehalose-phosphatase